MMMMMMMMMLLLLFVVVVVDVVVVTHSYIDAENTRIDIFPGVYLILLRL